MSTVWKYFKKDEKETHKARCLKCPKMLSCRGPSTSSLLAHLRNVHKIEIVTRGAIDEFQENQPSTSNTSVLPFKPVMKVSSDIGEIYSRCVAEDGMSVRAVKHSKILSDYLKSKGVKMPESENTIWNLIDKFFNDKKSETIDILKSIKEKKMEDFQ